MVTKIVYQADHNGYYLGPTTASESPLEPGVFLIPGGCVEDAPPAPGEHQVVQLVNGTWQLVTDPNYVQPPPPPSLDELKATKAEEISNACAAQIMGGLPSSALGQVYTYPTKLTDQSNLSASILDSLLPVNTADGSYTTPFWCMDGGGNWAWVNHTAIQIQQVGRDLKLEILNCQGKNANLQAQIQAATTIDAVNAITW